LNHRLRRRIVRIAVELLPIVTGVLIAMFVNEWNERRKQAEAFE
jgi:hypothetical protein